MFQVNVEAVVQDGKIRSLNYLPSAQPLRADAALDGRAQLPASVGLAAVLALLLSVVMIASTGLRRPAREASSLQGPAHARPPRLDRRPPVAVRITRSLAGVAEWQPRRVSNTRGETRGGSSPPLGTRTLPLSCDMFGRSR